MHDLTDVRARYQRTVETRKTSRSRPARMRGKHRAPLREWEYKLAEWVVAQHVTRKNIPFVELATMARVFQTECHDPDWPAERAFTKRDYMLLQGREDWRDYLSLLNKSVQEAARKKFADQSLKYVDAHATGLDLALEAKDHRQIYKYTAPALERIAPLRQLAAVTAIQVVLTAKQQQALDAPLPVVEAEVVDG